MTQESISQPHETPGRAAHPVGWEGAQEHLTASWELTAGPSDALSADTPLEAEVVADQAAATQPSDPRAQFLEALRQLPSYRLNAALLAAHEAGWRVTELGRALGVSYERIQQRISVGRYTPSASSIAIPEPPDRPRQRKFEPSAEAIARLVMDYKDGASLPELGARLGLSKRAVARILANAAIEVPPLRSETVTAAAPGIVNRYLAGDSIPDLVASTGISHSTVRRVLLDAEVQLRPRNGRAKHV